LDRGLLLEREVQLLAAAEYGKPVYSLSDHQSEFHEIDAGEVA
jgi:hypothetical protein